MFTKNNSIEFRPLMAGVTMRTLVFESRTILCEFKLERDSKIPPHQHPYEQTGHLISGKINFRIDKTWHLAEPGDSWCIPINVEHEVEILEDAVVFEIFSPIRPDYLP